jgi:Ca2+-binding RTX toxin-like protein
MPIQSTDIFKTGPDMSPGITFGIASQTWTIADGVFVGAQSNSGIVSNFDASTLINNGTVFSGNSQGVYFSRDNDVITNNAGRTITGRYSAIFVDGDHATINNHGLLAGQQYYGVIFGGGSNHAELNNDGEVYGGDCGVNVLSHEGGGAINNSGLIRSDEVGVAANSAAGLVTMITNATGATIKGTDAAILAPVGRISLENHGTLIGGVECTAAGGKDTVVNTGKIDGVVHLGPGNDAFDGKGGTSGKVFGEGGHDMLVGGSKADKLDGGNAGDVLKGGRGADRLDGGQGDDRLNGGKGTDQYIFKAAPGQGVDTIAKFQAGEAIKLDDAVFAGISDGADGHLRAKYFVEASNAQDGNDHIVYRQSQGKLYYDPDGDDPMDKILFARVDPGTHLESDDFMVI